MFVPTNRVELTSPNAHADLTSIKERRTNSTSRPIEDVNSGKNEVLFNEKKTLKRHLGLFSGISFILGMIIGSGIFVSPKGVLIQTQSVGLCLVIWVLCGVVSMLGALCYAEIGTVIPLSGSELVYMREGIGSVHLRTGDILAFVFNWANTFILEPSSVAILSLTFSTYFLSGIMDSCGPPIELVKMLAIFVVGVLGTVNGISVTAANRLNIAFVVCKTVTILVITIGGLVRIGQGYTQTLKSGFDGTANNPLSISLAFYSGLWAYSGWASLNSVTEELKNPKRNLWLSIVVALSSVIILYLLANISYFTVMNKAELLSSDAVAVTWGEAVLGPVVRLLPILISFSALGSANATIYTSGRYFMVGARYGYLPEIFSCIQKQRLTPLPSIILITILTIIYCIPSNIGNLIDFFSFVAWVFFGLTFVATICCKFTKPKAFRVIKVPIPIIIFMILVAIYLVIAPVISSPNVGYLIAVIILLVEKINMFFQEFFDLTIAVVNIEA
ncbi:unnamed protein product [Rotaria sordida]|uniref:b(0,+)-type amino acid transporter 1 n=1 Tax=Rotaria sordida TaxID=392033 RepID=A0A814UY34_9BILA|nr:unnamed protein product [Rotaria sordida]CAF1190781.1 unnamed protein product [Rotaria sordida]CAF1440527.1 unnamed protein product [Rotaria sordida]CAF1457356.1 unnamed protein product [Rotaria sordida]